jgi:hypothetical protein
MTVPTIVGCGCDLQPYTVAIFNEKGFHSTLMHHSGQGCVLQPWRTIQVKAEFFNEEFATELNGTYVLSEVKAYFNLLRERKFDTFTETKEVFFLPMPSTTDPDVIVVGIVNPDDPDAIDLLGTSATPLTSIFNDAPKTWTDFMLCDNGKPGFSMYTTRIKNMKDPPLHMKKYDVVMMNGMSLRFKVHMLQPYFSIDGKLIENDMLVDGGEVCTIELLDERAKVSGIDTENPVLVPSNPMLRNVIAKDMDMDELKKYLKEAHYKM